MEMGRPIGILVLVVIVCYSLFLAVHTVFHWFNLVLLVWQLSKSSSQLDRSLPISKRLSSFRGRRGRGYKSIGPPPIIVTWWTLTHFQHGSLFYLVIKSRPFQEINQLPHEFFWQMFRSISHALNPSGEKATDPIDCRHAPIVVGINLTTRWL